MESTESELTNLCSQARLPEVSTQIHLVELLVEEVLWRSLNNPG